MSDAQLKLTERDEGEHKEAVEACKILGTWTSLSAARDGIVGSHRTSLMTERARVRL